jgi:hypothetical protein
MVDLEGWMWCTLQNTDSNDVFSLAEAEERARLYGLDITKIVQRMVDRGTFAAPVVITKKGERPYLVSGNEHLMSARVLSIRPRVWLVDL